MRLGSLIVIIRLLSTHVLPPPKIKVYFSRCNKKIVPQTLFLIILFLNEKSYYLNIYFEKPFCGLCFYAPYPCKKFKMTNTQVVVCYILDKDIN